MTLFQKWHKSLGTKTKYNQNWSLQITCMFKGNVHAPHTGPAYLSGNVRGCPTSPEVMKSMQKSYLLLDNNVGYGINKVENDMVNP